MTIDIICPLYKGQQYIENLHKKIISQKRVKINKIYYIITKSDNDQTCNILDKYNVPYILIDKKDFSHSRTREKYALQGNGDIIVFITQDIDIVDDLWLYNLTRDLMNGKAQASYSRQLPHIGERGIEKYTRKYNYPNKSRYVTKNDIDELGLNTFYSSDASSATLRSVFEELGGFDGKDIPVSEDMYYTYKVIMKGYTVKYCSASLIRHSHDLSLKELYNRYVLIGKFFKQNPVFNQYGTNESGMRLAIKVFKGILLDFNVRALIKFIPNMVVRKLGMDRGKRN